MAAKHNFSKVKGQLLIRLLNEDSKGKFLRGII